MMTLDSDSGHSDTIARVRGGPAAARGCDPGPSMRGAAPRRSAVESRGSVSSVPVQCPAEIVMRPGKHHRLYIKQILPTLISRH